MILFLAWGGARRGAQNAMQDARQLVGVAGELNLERLLRQCSCFPIPYKASTMSTNYLTSETSVRNLPWSTGNSETRRQHSPRDVCKYYAGPLSN